MNSISLSLNIVVLVFVAFCRLHRVPIVIVAVNTPRAYFKEVDAEVAKVLDQELVAVAHHTGNHDVA